VPTGSSLAEPNLPIRPNADGQFEIRGISPGSYVLLATADGFSSDILSVYITDADVVGLIVPMTGLTTVQGRVAFEGRLTLDFSGMRVSAMRSGIAIDQVTQSTPDAHGTFTLTNVGPGEYDIHVERLPPNTYVKRIEVGTVDPLQGRVRFLPSQPLVIEIAPAPSSVGGHVMNAGNPAPGAQVVLIPDQRLRRRTDRYVTGYADKEGGFQLSGVPPGRYLAYAFERIEPAAYYAFAYSSAANARFGDRGVPVNVGESGATTVELRVIPAFETAGGLE
jgi:hypothetical protein